MNKISVIIPIYGVEKYIEQCVKSVINQTYKNIEILLIDDGSKDKSGLIIDELAKLDSRIKVVHKKNEGVSACLLYTSNYYIDYLNVSEVLVK